MNIEAYIVCWNEEEILPFTLDHYSQFCDRIVLLDNASDDKSLEIASQYNKVQVEQWCVDPSLLSEEEKSVSGIAPVYDERMLNFVKENCFKKYGKGADWVIIADCDEFYYHPNMRGLLEGYMLSGINYPTVMGFEMISEDFPEHDGELLVDKVRTGMRCEGMDKRLIFDPRVGYGSKLCYGAHGLYAREDLMKESEKDDIKLLHYKDLSVDYKVRRRKQLLSRRSEWTAEQGLCDHWTQSEEDITSSFEKDLTEAKEVIGNLHKYNLRKVGEGNVGDDKVVWTKPNT